MKITNDECVSCGKTPCLGDICPNMNVTRYYCDKCKEEYEPEELYITEYGELCCDCLLLNFQTVAQEEGL